METKPLTRRPRTIDYDAIDEDGLLITLKERSIIRRQKERDAIISRVHTWARNNGVKLSCRSMGDKDGRLCAVLVCRC